MRPSREVHRFVIRTHALGHSHSCERRFALGSARVSRAGDRVSRSRTFERLFRRDAETSTRDACATQKIVVHRFFNLPHRGPAMTGKTIERAELGESAQFFFRKRHAPLEIGQRMKLSILALPNEF